MDQVDDPAPMVVVKKAKVDDDPNNGEDHVEDMDLTGESSNLNPFTLEPVLKILMGQMSILDLVRARLVCNCWSDKATKCLEKAAQNDQLKPSQIMYDSDTTDFYDEALNKDIFNHFDLDFNFYIKQIGKRHDIKFLERYKVTWLKIKHSDFLKSHGLGHLLNLLKVISSTVKYLEFVHAIHFRKMSETPEPDYNVQLAEFTQLEEFIFTTDHEGVSRYTPQKPYSYILSSILNNSPKLRSITIEEFPKCREFYEILKNSQAALHTIRKLTIESLSFKIKVGGEEMARNFGQDFSNLQLEELKIIHVDNNFATLHEFLCTQASTLKSLQIGFHFYGKGSFRFKWPTFQALKVLKIYFNFGEMYGWSSLNWTNLFEPFALAETFPQLVHLEVNNFEGFLQIAQGGLKSVKILKPIEYNYEKHDPSYRFQYMYSTFNYSDLFERFPNLQVFYTNVSDFVNALESKVDDFKFWTESLKELHLYMDDLDDLLKIKLDHLKRLEFLYIEYYDLIDNEFSRYDRENECCELYSRTTVQENCVKLIENMTSFRDLKKLKKISFKFNWRIYEYNEDMGEQDIEERVLDSIAEKFSGSNIEFCLEKPEK